MYALLEFIVIKLILSEPIHFIDMDMNINLQQWSFKPFTSGVLESNQSFQNFKLNFESCKYMQTKILMTKCAILNYIVSLLVLEYPHKSPFHFGK